MIQSGSKRHLLYPMLAFALLLFTGKIARAQSQADLDALMQVLDTEKYEILAQRPEALNEMAFANRHGWHVAEMGDKDFTMYDDISSLSGLYPNAGPLNLEVLEAGTWNMAGYNVFAQNNNYSYFRIGNTGKVLVILPVALLRKKMLQNHE